MKNFSQTLATLIGLLLLGVAAYAAIAAIKYFGMLYMALDPQTAKLTTFISIIVLLCTLAIAHGIRIAAMRRMRQQLGMEIAAAYQYFMDYWGEMLNQKIPVNKSPEMLQTLGRFMALYGNSEVLKAHMALQTMMQEGGAQAADMRAQFGKALFAMRKDLGADTAGITAQQLQRLVLQEQDGKGPATVAPQSQSAPGAASDI